MRVIRIRDPKIMSLSISAAHSWPHCPPRQRKYLESCQFVKLVACFVMLPVLPLLLRHLKATLQPPGAPYMFPNSNVSHQCSLSPRNTVPRDVVVGTRPRRGGWYPKHPSAFACLTAGLFHASAQGHHGYFEHNNLKLVPGTWPFRNTRNAPVNVPRAL